MAGLGRQNYGAFGTFASAPVMVNPPYLVTAARRKYGRGILVIGTLDTQLNEFWGRVEMRATQFDGQRPHEVGRAVVDITAKEHVNNGDKDDTVQITDDKVETRSEKQTYSVSFKKSWEFGGNLNVGASFFNIIGVGGAALGLGGSFKKAKETGEEVKKEEERSLAQKYGVTGTITVPPNSKLKVQIITYAVNYASAVKVAFTVPVTAVLRFYYKSGLSKLCCGGTGATCRKNGFVTAEELFQNEDEFNISGGYIYYTRETDLSYLGETVEMFKEQTSLI